MDKVEEMTPEEAACLGKLTAYCKERAITQFDSDYLLRFVRARKADYPKVEKMFGDFIAWRKEHDVENIDVAH
jgi:hypothetical protein